MVLDCGGGTIDITSHLVESSDPLQLSELAEPCGGAWGSSIVDSRFKAFLQVRGFDDCVYSRNLSWSDYFLYRIMCYGTAWYQTVRRGIVKDKFRIFLSFVKS